MHPRSKKPCACGCGEMVLIGMTTSGKERCCVQGHNRRGKHHTKRSRKMMSVSHSGKTLSKEHCQALSDASRGLPKWSRGKTYDEMYGPEKAEEILKKITKSNTGKVRTKKMRKHYSEGRLIYLSTARPARYTNTSIERALKKELRRRRIPLRSQAKIGSFLVDIKICGVPLAIECDGDYWHGLDSAKTKDLVRNRVVPEKLGGPLLIFMGSEIRQDVKKCGRIVQRVYKELVEVRKTA